MTEQPFDHGSERPQSKSIAGGQPRRRGPIFGRSMKVACTEYDRGEISDVFGMEGKPAGQPYFDRFAGRNMLASQARRQSRCVVGDHEVAGPKKLHEPVARGMTDISISIDDEQLRA